MGSRAAECRSLRSEAMRSREDGIPQATDVMLSSWDVVYAQNMAVACLVSYWIMTHALSRLVGVPSDLLGGMCVVVATVFVFRESQARSRPAGINRLIASRVSFALCLLYLSPLPFNPVRMAALIFIGAVAMALHRSMRRHRYGRNNDRRRHGHCGDDPQGRLAAAIASSCRHCCGDHCRRRVQVGRNTAISRAYRRNGTMTPDAVPFGSSRMCARSITRSWWRSHPPSVASSGRGMSKPVAR
jgi:hypothetical protein